MDGFVNRSVGREGGNEGMVQEQMDGGKKAGRDVGWRDLASSKGEREELTRILL